MQAAEPGIRRVLIKMADTAKDEIKQLHPKEWHPAMENAVEEFLSQKLRGLSWKDFYDESTCTMKIPLDIPSDTELYIQAMFEVAEEGNKHRGGDSVYTAPGEDTFTKAIYKNDMNTPSNEVERRALPGLVRKSQYLVENIDARLAHDGDIDSLLDQMEQDMVDYVASKLQG